MNDKLKITNFLEVMQEGKKTAIEKCKMQIEKCKISVNDARYKNLNTDDNATMRQEDMKTGRKRHEGPIQKKSGTCTA